MTLDKEQLTIPKSWSDHLEPIYIQLVSKIQYHCSYGNVNPTLRLLPKPVGAYNWEPIPELVSPYTLHNFEGVTIEEEESTDVRDFNQFELKNEDSCT